ncbi:MAG: hypothetical protein H6606_02170 [Flavobacteriales bacterium]|nr:hypothetical protein [Flavobacteriales bacterium]
MKFSFLLVLLFLSSSIHAQIGYTSVLVVNNSAYDICINNTSEDNSCSGPGVIQTCVYRNLASGNSTTLTPCVTYIVSVTVLNHGCPNACGTPTSIAIGPGSGVYSGSFTECGSGNTTNYSWTPNPGLGCPDVTGATLTFN